VSLTRGLFRLLLGRRLPITEGSLRVDGIDAGVTVRRDEWGIPHIDAASDADLAFATGFCHAQDRAFQLEMLLRAGRGTLSALVGADGLPIDRLSRRMGLHVASVEQAGLLDADVRETLAAYAAGVNAGFEHGLRRPAHEFALLRRAPTPWTLEDCLGTAKLVAFGLSTNWDIELCRLQVLAADGPEALRAIDPAYPAWQAVITPTGAVAGPAVDRLADEAAALARATGFAGAVPGTAGSNNWAIGPARTATGRPLLANDPHLSPTLPPFWYLLHGATPEWAAAGASVCGLPGVVVGHNGHAAWGATNSGADVVDLFLEELGEDGRSVRGPDGWERCTVREERIEVKGGDEVVEEVLVTPRGPIVSPALAGEHPAVSMRAVFLAPLPLRVGPRIQRSRSFEEFRASWRGWPLAPINFVYADAGGTIGYQLAGHIPRRRRSSGLVPWPAAQPGGEWDGPIDHGELPHCADPPAGFVATANNKPVADGTGPFLGADWMDGYRAQRITEELAAREDWDVDACTRLQLDQTSLPWRELRSTVLAVDLGAAGEHAERARELLEGWDGVVAADSPAAAVFELFLADLVRRVAQARAPRSVEWALGRGAGPLITTTYLGLRHTGHVVRLLRERPQGWFAGGWDAEVAGALAAAVEQLERDAGSDTAGWAWGRLRPLTLRHPLGERRPFDRLYNLGPIALGGDTNTPAQASNSPLEPTADPLYLGTLRLVVDVGEWDESRFVLAGGQSGNPLSPHYADQWERWRRGESVAIAWSPERVEAATRATLSLEPTGGVAPAPG